MLIKSVSLWNEDEECAIKIYLTTNRPNYFLVSGYTKFRHTADVPLKAARFMTFRDGEDYLELRTLEFLSADYIVTESWLHEDFEKKKPFSVLIDWFYDN